MALFAVNLTFFTQFPKNFWWPFFAHSPFFLYPQIFFTPNFSYCPLSSFHSLRCSKKGGCKAKKVVGVNTQNTPGFCARGTTPCYATACCITWCINCCITCIITYSITCGNTCCINCITCSSTCCIAWSITFINVVSLVVSPAVSPVLSPLPPVVSTAISPVLSLVVSPAVSGVAWVSDAWVDLKFAAPPHVQSHIFLAHSYGYFWWTFFLNIKFFPPPCASFRSIKVFSYPENFSKP